MRGFRRSLASWDGDRNSTNCWEVTSFDPRKAQALLKSIAGCGESGFLFSGRRGRTDTHPPSAEEYLPRGRKGDKKNRGLVFYSLQLFFRTQNVKIKGQRPKTEI